MENFLYGSTGVMEILQIDANGINSSYLNLSPDVLAQLAVDFESLLSNSVVNGISVEFGVEERPNPFASHSSVYKIDFYIHMFAEIGTATSRARGIHIQTVNPAIAQGRVNLAEMELVEVAPLFSDSKLFDLTISSLTEAILEHIQSQSFILEGFEEVEVSVRLDSLIYEAFVNKAKALTGDPIDVFLLNSIAEGGKGKIFDDATFRLKVQEVVSAQVETKTEARSNVSNVIRLKGGK